jgi:hypothetical protein
MAYDITYNKETYRVTIELARLDRKDPTLVIQSSIYTLVQDYISRIQLINDMNDYFPYMEIEYTDKGHNLWKRYCDDGYTTMKFAMSQYRSEGQEPVALSHSFIVSSIKLIDMNINQATYRVKCTSALFHLLRSYSEYSTGENYMPATMIAKLILIKAGYPIATGKGDTESSAETVMPYISPANFTVLQNVKYLMKKAIAPGQGMFYLFYNMLSGNGTIANLNDLFNKYPQNVNNRNAFEIPAITNNPISFMNMADMKCDNMLTGPGSFNFLGKTTLNNFDYLTRTWNKKSFDYKKLVDMLPSLNQQYKDFKKIYRKIPANITKNDKYDREETSVAYDAIYDKLNMLYQYYSVMQFNNWGSLQRDIGQVIGVVSQDGAMMGKYGGAWMISRITHSFTRDNYVNNIIAVRTTGKDTDNVFTDQSVPLAQTKGG